MTIDLGHLAGVVDGEGCVGVYRDGKTWRLVVSITQNWSPVVDRYLGELTFLFGGTVTRGERILVYRCQGVHAFHLLQKISGLVVFKRDQVELAMHWWLSSQFPRDFTDDNTEVAAVRVSDRLKRMKRGQP